MTGSENQLKISQPKANQLPLKGFYGIATDERTKREYAIEGMGAGRYRVHTRKRQPKQK